MSISGSTACRIHATDVTLSSIAPEDSRPASPHRRLERRSQPQPMQCKAPATNIGVLGLDQQGDLGTGPAQELDIDQPHGTSADDADLRISAQGFGSLVEVVALTDATRLILIPKMLSIPSNRRSTHAGARRADLLTGRSGPAPMPKGLAHARKLCWHCPFARSSWRMP